MHTAFHKDDIENVAKQILGALERHQHDGATVLALSGDLGAGKTTLTQTIARLLGVSQPVVSPTFVIMKSYQLHGQSYERLVHIDAYRLASAEELLKLGWDELVRDSANLIVIEWPERVEGILPENTPYVFLAHGAPEHRELRVSW